MSTTTSTIEEPRAKRRYLDELRPQLQERLGLANIMQVPRLEKIVLNMGVGQALVQKSLLDGAVSDLTIITGQKPVVTRAKKSIAGFKLREGDAVGARVTLRGDRMWEFYDRLVSIAVPRDPGLPWAAGEFVRRQRQLHVRRDRTADLSGDRLRQGRLDQGHGHHDRDDRPYQRRGPRTARGSRLPVQA